MKKEKTYIYRKTDYELTGIERNNQLIEEEYKMKIKHGKVDIELKKQYESLKNRTKKVSDIRKVIFIKDAYLGKRLFSKELYSFIVVETKDGICLLYNITTGEDHSFDFNREIHIIENITNIITLYSYEDIQEDIELGYMDCITMYKNIILRNVYTAKDYVKSSYIEFKDNLNHVFYIDIFNNKIYLKNNCYDLIDKEKCKKVILYSERKNNNVDVAIFTNTYSC